MATTMVGEKVDPLDLMRNTLVMQSKPNKQGDFLVFSVEGESASIPMTFEVGVRSRSGDYLDMGSIWFMMERVKFNEDNEENLPYNLRTCADHNHKFISAGERKELLYYLEGKTNALQSLVDNPPLFTITGPMSPGRRSPKKRPIDPAQLLLEATMREEKKLRANAESLHSGIDPRIALEAIETARAELTGEIDSQLQKPMRAYQYHEEMRQQNLLYEIRMRGYRPTIVVPQTQSSVINILNIKQLLEHGRWSKPTSDMWRSRPKEEFVAHTVGGELFEFRVVDSTAKFTKNDWKSTVAVIVDGKDWQLKGWPFASHGQLFNAIRGFHLYMDNLGEAENCKSWSVAKISLKRNARHQDPAVMMEFWRILEKFLLQKRRREFTATVQIA